MEGVRRPLVLNDSIEQDNARLDRANKVG